MAKEPDKQLVVDSRFSLPPGIIDVRSDNQDDGEFFYQSGDIAVDGPVLSDPATSTVPLPSTSFTIAYQQVRIASDGRAVVDVYLDFPDTPGVEDVEVRTTKV